MQRVFVAAILAAVLIALSGCTTPAQASEQKAIELADNTPEGSMASELASKLEGVESCTPELLLATAVAAETATGISVFGSAELSDAQKLEFAQQAIADATSCRLGISKTAEQKSQDSYLVSYIYTYTPEGCLAASAESFVDVEVNVATGAVNIAKGELSEDARLQVEALIVLAGNCIDPFMRLTQAASGSQDLNA